MTHARNPIGGPQENGVSDTHGYKYYFASIVAIHPLHDRPENQSERISGNDSKPFSQKV